VAVELTRGPGGRAAFAQGVDRFDGLALAAALVTVSLWASAFVGIRAVAPVLSPGALALGRLMIGSLALGAVVVIRRPAMPSRNAVPPIVACGVLWFGLYNVALNTAERYVDAGTAAMLGTIGPILVAFLGGLFLGEGFPRRLLVGSAIALLGAVAIGFATSGASPGSDSLLGIVLCLVAATAYAVAVTVQKPVLATTPALTVTWLSCLVATVMCLPFAPQLVVEVGAAQSSTVVWLVYLGLFPTSVAFTTWAFALSRTTAGRLASTVYLAPAIAIVLGWLLLGEVPPALAVVGGAVAVSGVAIARSSPSGRRQVEPASRARAAN
jgi:drug/metabolite transporter (DMT)-like permease